MANKTDKDFQEAMAMCREIFKKKLYDYKPSWRMLRPESLTDQLFIKAKRIRTLEITKDSEGKNHAMLKEPNYIYHISPEKFEPVCNFTIDKTTNEPVFEFSDESIHFFQIVA